MNVRLDYAWNMKKVNGWRACLLFSSFVGTTLIFFVYSSIEIYIADPVDLLCHFIKLKESLPDVSDITPSVNVRNIFFLETSCNSHEKGRIFIKARQACAVESAAKMNPSMDVYLLYASSGIIQDDSTESDRLLKALKSYPNIKILHMDLERFIKDTPVESLWMTGKMKTSLYPMAHTSDILRLLVLWKFGGIYMDLDVIVAKSLENFPDNFAGAQSETVIANGVMGFSKFGRGHDYVSACMDDVRVNFDGRIWAYNGPHLITKIIASQCPAWEIADLIQYGKCDEFMIFPSSAFYLVPYPKWEWFFMKNLTEIMKEHIMEKSYMIHVWNKLSYNMQIPKNQTDVPYLNFATTYCPKVVEELDEVF